MNMSYAMGPTHDDYSQAFHPLLEPEEQTKKARQRKRRLAR